MAYQGPALGLDVGGSSIKHALVDIAAGRLLTVPEVVMTLESLHRVQPEVPAGGIARDWKGIRG